MAQQGFGVQRRGVKVNFEVILCLDCEGLREVRVPRERVLRRRKTLEAPTGASQGDEKEQYLKQMGWQRSVVFQKPRGVVKEGGIHCGLGRDHGFSTTEAMSRVGGGGPDGQMEDGNG